MIGVQLHPVDTWFFRDGTPFTMDSAPQEDVGSLFPPHPPTVVGALRAALARARGWDGRDSWPRDVCAVLGDGPDNLGALSFTGPFLLRDGQPLFRVPRHLLGTGSSGRWEPAALLRPGGSVACDLGDSVRLPALPDTAGKTEKFQAGDGQWLTHTGMNEVLRGCVPDPRETMANSALWADEVRIGLERDPKSRTAKESMLYSTRHVRLRRCVSLGVRVAGVPPDWPPPFRQLIPLGGENRLADCQEWNTDVRLKPPWTRIRETRQAALVALSPLDLAEPVRGGGTVVGLDSVRVVSACLDRPQRIGGWNTRTRSPLPTRSVLPPGSVLFCELRDPERFAASVDADGLARFGARREWGFGLAAIGVWPSA